MNKSYKKAFKLITFLGLFFACSKIFSADADVQGFDAPRSERQSKRRSSSNLMGDLDLEKTQHSWTTVLSGRAIAEPARTSYGWAVLTEGRMLCALSEEGAVLWQRALPSSPENFITVSDDGFCAVPMKNKRLCLLNPSGIVLWTGEMGFQAASAPLFGRDGRVFAFGKSELACFGANGIRKWSMKTEAQNILLSPAELNDGSLLIFLEELQEGKTVVLRLSPFGEQMERVVLAARATAALSVPSGVLLLFEDGTLGLCEAGKGGAQSAWTIKDFCSSPQKAKFVELDSSSLFALAFPSSSALKISVANCKTAQAIREFSVPEVKSALYVSPCADAIFLSDKNSAAIYSTGGRKIRSIKFPKKKTADYVLFGRSGSVILLSSSWAAEGWKAVSASPQPQKDKDARPSYGAFYDSERADFFRAKKAPSKKRRAALSGGEYGALEKGYWNDAQAAMDEYFSKRKGGQKGLSEFGEELFSFGERVEVISSLGLFGTDGAADFLAKVIREEKDGAVLRAALGAVKECGYDPDFLVIGAIEAAARDSSPSRDAVLAECCDAVYSICRFMGRPAFFKKGRSILSNFLQPQYGKSVKENARKNYEKLAEIDL